MSENMQMLEKLNKMTKEEHSAMKEKLLKMAKNGEARPDPSSFEDFCLRAYTLLERC